MKFNIEIDLEWVGENRSIDDAIRAEMVEHIVERLGDEVMGQLMRDAKSKMETRLDKVVNAFFDTLLKEGVTVTDEWGAKQKENVTVEALAREKLRKALTEEVDERGSSSGYGRHHTRLEWLVDQRIKKVVDLETGEIAKQFDAKLKEIFGAALRDRLTESLLKNIDLEALLAEKVASKEGR